MSILGHYRNMKELGKEVAMISLVRALPSQYKVQSRESHPFELTECIDHQQRQSPVGGKGCLQPGFRVFQGAPATSRGYSTVVT